MDRLEHLGHQPDLGLGYYREYVAVKMHHAALVRSVWEHFSHRFQHPQALVANNELYAIQSAAFQPLEELNPAGLVLFHLLGSAQSLPVAVFIDRNRHRFVLATPAAEQMTPSHKAVRLCEMVAGSRNPTVPA